MISEYRLSPIFLLLEIALTFSLGATAFARIAEIIRVRDCQRDYRAIL